MNLDEAKGALVEEGRELLLAMEEALLAIEQSGPDAEAINAIFRAAHTIKGSAGLFGLQSLVDFTHLVESLLDKVRNNELAVEPAMLSLLLRCGDYIGELLSAVEASGEDQDPDAAKRLELMKELGGFLRKVSAVAATPPTSPVQVLATDAVSNECWHISLRPSLDVLRNGMDPLSIFRYLGKLGRIVHIHTLTDALPALDSFDEESGYLGFELEFASDASKQEIEDAFEFIREDSQLLILPPHSAVAAYIELIASLPEEPALLGELLVQSGALTAHELDKVLARQREDTIPQPIGEMLVQAQHVAGPVVSAALTKQKQSEQKKAQEQVFIKVEVSKLDQLINLVGELVIAGAAANMAMSQNNIEAMAGANEDVIGLVEMVRDASLSLRMVAIGEVFQRFPRVVRDISQELGKDIALTVTGADTELDKSMVEKLADPLMHIVRNAMDHGIEPAEQRLASGKVAKGSLHLNAHHDSGSIVIEVSDDGRGLNKEKILAKAIEKGLVQPEQSLTDSEIFNLIFEPGFSTASEITNLSGRGVGMDVVRRNIEQLRGVVEVSSQQGQGTRVQIRLPLTLAIIDGFQVKVAEQILVLPLDQVVECVDLGQGNGHNDLFNLRGEPLPFVRLRELFELGQADAIRESLVVLQFGQNRAGVVVDKLLGESQAVIKPLGQLFGQSKMLSGSTILGDGSVALILDVPNLIQRACSTAKTTSQDAMLARAAAGING
ncbi:chemotaxis protein CheA [Gallaecimonas mangrovi]|uniref:chemotaxis protein CheA n=1 Tax=Gallaecimonas mangrovi TaxID=2291597 RepID=UPI000E1FDCA4|nr:chemotaxis protein CheA [Gallaecimonas mangrovi]